mmetsp:Transcript_12883/g.45281  ORF Transcript_12883/g.45281 Transcript_12883/m.45281 type:complete len:133 (+) Transcript_12883:2877-3275(+)
MTSGTDRSAPVPPATARLTLPAVYERLGLCHLCHSDPRAFRCSPCCELRQSVPEPLMLALGAVQEDAGGTELPGLRPSLLVRFGAEEVSQGQEYPVLILNQVGDGGQVDIDGAQRPQNCSRERLDQSAARGL